MQKKVTQPEPSCKAKGFRHQRKTRSCILLCCMRKRERRASTIQRIEDGHQKPTTEDIMKRVGDELDDAWNKMVPELRCTLIHVVNNRFAPTEFCQRNLADGDRRGADAKKSHTARTFMQSEGLPTPTKDEILHTALLHAEARTQSFHHSANRRWAPEAHHGRHHEKSGRRAGRRMEQDGPRAAMHTYPCRQQQICSY